MEFQGLRFAVTLGSVGTVLGSWLKVFSVAPNLFWLTFVGQTLLAMSQTFILSIPARLAAVWFGPDQVSTACSVGVFGNQVSTQYIRKDALFYFILSIFIFSVILYYLLNN